MPFRSQSDSVSGARLFRLTFLSPDVPTPIFSTLAPTGRYMRVQNGGKRPRHTQTSIDRQIHKNLFFFYFSFCFSKKRKRKSTLALCCRLGGEVQLSGHNLVRQRTLYRCCINNKPEANRIKKLKQLSKKKKLQIEINTFYEMGGPYTYTCPPSVRERSCWTSVNTGRVSLSLKKNKQNKTNKSRS